jgi:N-acetylmuramoyl-L-alanine amidase
MSRIVPYAEWCDTPFNFTPSPIATRQQDVWLHHGAAGTSTIPVARRYAADHAARAGWAGIGYSWLVADGKVLEGRGVGRQGSHTQGWNSSSYGICIVGNYSVSEPSHDDLNAVAWLLNYGYQQGWFARAELSGGHRDVGSTSCPGDRLYRKIDHINLLALGNSVSETPNTIGNRNVADDMRRIRISLRAIGNALNVPVDIDGPADGTTVIA